MRLICAERLLRSSPRPARRDNSSSGIVDQRKYESREAKLYSSTLAKAAPRGERGSLSSKRNRNRGDERAAIIADATPVSKVLPGWVRSEERRVGKECR